MLPVAPERNHFSDHLSHKKHIKLNAKHNYVHFLSFTFVSTYIYSTINVLDFEVSVSLGYQGDINYKHLTSELAN